MSSTFIQYGLAAIAVAAAFAMAPTAAEAKIRCDGRWQIVKGQRIATPYCGDAYLARVARTYGSSVSARVIRNNPLKKQEICNWIGHDTRVSDICAGSRDQHRPGAF